MKLLKLNLNFLKEFTGCFLRKNLTSFLNARERLEKNKNLFNV